MDLYENADSHTRWGRFIQHYGGLLLIGVSLAGLVGAVFILRPYATAAWGAFVAPLLESILQAINM